MLLGLSIRFFVTIGLYNRNNSEIGEVFINTAGRAGNEADIMAADAAVAISLALQYGCPIEVMTAAMSAMQMDPLWGCYRTLLMRPLKWLDAHERGCNDSESTHRRDVPSRL